MNKKFLILKTSILILLVFTSSFIPVLSIQVFALQGTGNVTNNTNKITNDKIDITRGMDTTDYFSSAYALFNQTQKLQKEIESTNSIQTIETDKSLMVTDWQEIKSLEQKNIKSYQVPDDIKQELLSAEQAIRNKYIVSENGPILSVFTDFKYRHIVVFIDKDQEKNDTIIVENGVKQKLILRDDAVSIRSFEPNNNIPVEVHHGKFIHASCNNQNSTCTPLVGGVSISLKDNIPYNSLNTLGYAANLNGQPGFVIAGHTVQKLANPDEFDNHIWTPSQWIGRQIVQPFNQNNVIGTVTGIGITQDMCDCAFVATTTQQSNNIFISGSTPVQITYNKPSFEQAAGSFVEKSGARSGTTFGQLKYQAIAGPGATAQLDAAGGDSGSPIFSGYDGTTASLNGVLHDIFSDPTGNYVVYAPWDYIQGRLGAIPALSNPNPPPVSLNPSSAQVGSYAHISGSGFTPNSQLTITLDTQIFSAGTDSTGSFLTYFQIPPIVVNTHSFVMTVSDGHGHLGTAILTIQPSTLVSTSSGYAGQSRSVSGTYFSPNSNVISTMGGNTIASSVSDSQGSFNSTFVVPSLPLGAYQIQSTDNSGNSASTQFTVASQNVCSPTQNGDWNVTSSCTMSSSVIAHANVIVQSNTVLTVPSNTTLTIHFGTNHLLVQPGGKVIIQSGGKLSS